MKSWSRPRTRQHGPQIACRGVTWLNWLRLFERWLVLIGSRLTLCAGVSVWGVERGQSLGRMATLVVSLLLTQGQRHLTIRPVFPEHEEERGESCRPDSLDILLSSHPALLLLRFISPYLDCYTAIGCLRQAHSCPTRG